MNVVCIGAGYVGSVTGAAFAAIGHHTTVIDVDQNKVNILNAKKSPIYEPGLDYLIEAVSGTSLFATTSFDVIYDADVVFLCVGTPEKEDGSADLTYIKLAAESVGTRLNANRFTTIVNKSTVPVGTADLVTSILETESGLRAEENFTVISNPEFLREGYAIADVFFPDRIVIGTTNERARAVMRDLYRNLIERTGFIVNCDDLLHGFTPEAAKARYFETDPKSAEMIKYAANAFLAVKISYINEIARLCEALGANVLDVATGIGLDSRIGEKFLQVSSGWSGSCFPKDTAELLTTSQKYGSELLTVRAAVESNSKNHQFVVEKIQRKLKTLNGKNIGILGLTFKPNTDDARKTQASVIIKKLLQLGANIKVHDPQGMEAFQKVNPQLQVHYCESAADIAHNSDGLVLLTHWDDYQTLDWANIFMKMRYPYLLDTRNVLPQQKLEQAGFIYEGLGIGIMAKSGERQSE